MIKTEILIFQVIIVILAAFCLVVFSVIFWLCYYFKQKVMKIKHAVRLKLIKPCRLVYHRCLIERSN